MSLDCRLIIVKRSGRARRTGLHGKTPQFAHSFSQLLRQFSTELFAVNYCARWLKPRHEAVASLQQRARLRFHRSAELLSKRGRKSPGDPDGGGVVPRSAAHQRGSYFGCERVIRFDVRFKV